MSVIFSFVNFLILLIVLLKGFEFIFIKFVWVIMLGILVFLNDFVMVLILWIIKSWLLVVEERGLVWFLLLINIVLNGVLICVLIVFFLKVVFDILLNIVWVIIGL